MIVNLYKLIEKKFKQNIEDETTLNLALDVLNQRENLTQENQKYKEAFNKAIKYIEENKQHEYRNGNLDEYYLELNEKEMTELLDILKEAEDK